jgi:hydroxylaminobenzene mutase
MTTSTGLSTRLAHRLLQLGMSLFILGLLTGFGVPALANPRAGLTSHLEGVLNGILLLVLGSIWQRLRLGVAAQRWAFWLAIYGTFVNWLSTLLAAAWGAGGALMPLSAAGYPGTSAQEAVIGFGLISLSFAMLVVGGLVLWGLR